MSSRKRSGGGTAGRGASAPLSVMEDASLTSAVFNSPERPEATGQSEPLWLSGIVATANASDSTYVTKDNLASALAGLKGKIAGMIASVSQGGRKWDRSSAHEPSPALERDWAEDVEEVAVNDQEKGQATDSTSEESGSEEPFSASQSQRLLF